MNKFIKREDDFKRFIVFLILTVFVAVVGFCVWVPDKKHVREETTTEISYLEFMDNLESGKYTKVLYSSGYATMFAIDNEDTYYVIKNADNEGLKLKLLESGVKIEARSTFKTAESAEETKRVFVIITLLITGSYLIFFGVRMFMEDKDSGSSAIVNKRKSKVAIGKDDGKSTVSNLKDSSIKTFDDVAGLKEVKEDMKCIVDFLINKEKYTAAGAKLPKGIILYGPPGTGKTLLAKAVAGEADVPFLYMSGSEFVEMYVGVGAKRVRELFDKARKQAPCIVFIDEIDAMGGRRTEADNSEDRKTLNALLTEMDGFKDSENIIVIGATNRLEDLDSALTRPGRFTNKYCVPLPETIEERLEIINIYSKNKMFDETVDFRALAKEMIGFSPAKIEALLNESAIISVQLGSKFITKDIIDKAMFKLLLNGHMKEDMAERREDDLNVVAWHEAGHAVVGCLLGKDITKVTIVSSTSGAGGVTFSVPENKAFHSITDIENNVMEFYGGRVAEYLYFNKDKTKVTTGASNDIERATALIRDSIVKYGMSPEFGLINLNNAKVSDDRILKEQIEMSKRIEVKTVKLLESNKDKLIIIANLLLEKHTIYASDIKEVFAA